MNLINYNVYIYIVNNNNFIEKGKALVHEEYTREPGLYLLLQSRKQIRSTKFLKVKLGTYTIAQSRRDPRKDDLRRITLVLLSSKSHRFLSLQMLQIKSVVWITLF